MVPQFDATFESIDFLAEFCTGWVPGWISAAEYPARIDEIRALARAKGRGDVDFVIGTEIFAAVDWTHERAYELSRRTFAALPLGFQTNPPEEKIRRSSLVGSAEEVREQVDRFVKSGVRHFELKFIYHSIGHLLEQMELFRKHRVNPMGGCLPMVVQIPIFYALYLTLQYSVELQGAHFLLWITDLSRKDPYYVLPILMGGSMLGQQLMTPTVGDPRQARVMLIMPVIFTFMFLNLPSGLVLYWTVSNVLQILQQKLMDRPARTRATREAKDAGRA